jgi:hypothetical protein
VFLSIIVPGETAPAAAATPSTNASAPSLLVM